MFTGVLQKDFKNCILYLCYSSFNPLIHNVGKWAKHALKVLRCSYIESRQLLLQSSPSQMLQGPGYGLGVTLIRYVLTNFSPNGLKTYVLAKFDVVSVVRGTALLFEILRYFFLHMLQRIFFHLILICFQLSKTKFHVYRRALFTARKTKFQK